MAEYAFGIRGIAGALAMAEQKLRAMGRHTGPNAVSEWCGTTCHRVQGPSPFSVRTLLNITTGLVRDAG